jgi:hypothetical protein
MGKYSMMCLIKSICATPTDARAIIKCQEKSDAGYSEKATALDRAHTIASDTIFLQI